MFRKVHIADIPFPVINYSDSINVFQKWIKSHEPHQVCIVNVHTLVTTIRVPQLQNIMQKSDMNTMDGQPLRWYANSVCSAGVKERVCGPELMRRCIEQGVAEGWRHFLLGGRPEVLQTLEERLDQQFPGVLITGSYSPPFRPSTEEEETEMVEHINKTGADFLWVGLGAPRQEHWIARNLYRLKVPVCVGVGAAFDFHAGSVPRAPSWIQALGMEWLYRSFADPRLLHRYLDTNPPFLWILIRDLFRVRILRQSYICDVEHAENKK